MVGFKLSLYLGLKTIHIKGMYKQKSLRQRGKDTDRDNHFYRESTNVALNIHIRVCCRQKLGQ